MEQLVLSSVSLCLSICSSVCPYCLCACLFVFLWTQLWKQFWNNFHETLQDYRLMSWQNSINILRGVIRLEVAGCHSFSISITVYSIFRQCLPAGTTVVGYCTLLSHFTLQLPKNYNSIFEFIKIVYKILLVSFFQDIALLYNCS